MPQKRKIWFKGQIMPAEDAQISVLSPTAQFGLNVFEGIRGYWNAESEDVFLFRLDDHLDRLFASCRLIGLDCPYAPDEIRQAIIQVIHENDYRADLAVRATLFVDGEGTWHSSTPVEMFVAPIAKPRRDVTNDAGLRACVSTWRRIDDLSMPPRVKAGANYINGRYAHLEAKAAGYDLPILLDGEGKVSEGAGSCVMLVRDGVLITPPTSGSILESITRDTLLQLVQATDMPTEVRIVDRSELYLADEIFLCGSAAELTPITGIDRFMVGDGRMGPVTRALLAAYLDIADGTDPAHPEWRRGVWQAESDT